MTICQLPYFIYESKNFNLEARSGTGRTNIFMRLKCSNVCTAIYPQTIDILTKELPEVLDTECFNDKNLPFEKEVLDTEIAHLLEHLMLQILYSEKTKSQNTEVEYNGSTKWNWKKEDFGTFHIEVDSGYSDGKLLKKAIKKAVMITEMVLNSPQVDPIEA